MHPPAGAPLRAWRWASRRGLVVTVALPDDVTAAEVERMAAWLRALVLP